MSEPANNPIIDRQDFYETVVAALQEAKDERAETNNLLTEVRLDQREARTWREGHDKDHVRLEKDLEAAKGNIKLFSTISGVVAAAVASAIGYFNK